VSLIAVAALLNAACFNIVVEETQPHTESMTVMPVLGEVNLLPGSQASNQETDNFDAPELDSVAGVSVPTLNPGAALTVAPEPLPAYQLTVNGVPVIDSTLTLDGGRVEVSLPPEEPSGLYADGFRIQLTAIPGKGYRFDAWEGDCIRDGGVCTITFDRNGGNKDLIAGFVPLDEFFKMDLVAEPDGGGEVQVEPSPTAPDGRYANGTHLELKAIDSEGFRFNGWYGACAGNDRECRVVMNADHSVTATFAPDFYALTINRVLVDGAGVSLGHGQIVVFPFSASSDKGFARSAIVSLTPGPDAGYDVVDWGGDCSGLEPDASECILVMDRDRFVEITFAQKTDDRHP
jgi:hypothetical protein